MVTMLKNKCSVWKRIKFPTFWYNCYYFTWSDTYFILVQLETLLINHPSYLVSHVRVRTHQRSRVESNPVQSDSQRRGSDSLAYFQWPPRQCVHTNRVESSPVTRVLPSQESWCRMFYFRQSDSSDRAWRPLYWRRNGCGICSFSRF